MKSIILEGIDGVGKSTIARQLGGYFNLGIYSIGSKPENDEKALYMSKHQVEIAQTVPVIFDRLTAISRICYEKELSIEHCDLLRKDLYAIVAQDPIMIWCTVPQPIHEVKDYDSKSHLIDIETRSSAIKYQYAEMMSQLEHIHYDFTEMTQQELMQEIQQCL